MLGECWGNAGGMLGECWEEINGSRDEVRKEEEEGYSGGGRREEREKVERRVTYPVLFCVDYTPQYQWDFSISWDLRRA